MNITPGIRQAISPSLAIVVACVGLLVAPSARAVAVNQADAGFSVPCISDSAELECNGSHFRRTQTSRGVGGQSAADSLVVDLTPDVRTGTISSAQADTGRLKASVFSTLVVSDSISVTSGSFSTGQASAFFQDDWTIRGPTDALRRVTLHFSLDGSVDDLGGIALPFNQVNGAGGSAFANLSVNIRPDSGTNRRLAPVAIGPGGGSLTQCIGRGGCGEPGFQEQSLDVVFDVAGGNTLSILSSLFVQADGSAYADFFNTAKLDYVTAPDDIDIVTASGDLFRQGDRFIYRANANLDPPPVSSVPEPDSLYLIAFGMVAIGVHRRRAQISREARAA